MSFYKIRHSELVSESVNTDAEKFSMTVIQYTSLLSAVEAQRPKRVQYDNFGSA
ncbi:hypothetical protein [Treponema zioleckii]|uniref:hypothetical protein n=1 Tax=Treponema zioleckii TaxID=331680 RepID=UPI00168B715F|nr:hypothetical protein [Treponema zioleckii]